MSNRESREAVGRIWNMRASEDTTTATGGLHTQWTGTPTEGRGGFWYSGLPWITEKLYNQFGDLRHCIAGAQRTQKEGTTE